MFETHDQLRGSEADEKTRQRLLDAAGEAFAEHGYRGTTVREICRRAGANVAAINYHFGDKERLYTEALRYSHGYAIKKYPPTLGVAPDAPAEERLRAFVKSFLLRILDLGRNSWHGKLMTKEMADPTAALDFLVPEHVKPVFMALSGIVGELLGPGARPEDVRRYASSVVGQILFYHFGRPVIERLNPGMKIGIEQIDELAEHITRFSLTAIRGFGKTTPAKQGGKRKPAKARRA